MDIFIRTAQLLLSLSILVIVHELGHFLFARYFNTRVEKFYLFFNPWFSLFKRKIGDTVYGIGWLPLGGYVKIAGMIDESMDRSQMASEPKDWEFRSKPAYQRFLIMFGGVLFNFLLALAIYSMVLFVWGREYLPVQNAEYGIYCDSLALDIGLQHGDKIISIGGKSPETFSDIMLMLVVDGSRSIMAQRNGRNVEINVPSDFAQKVIASGKQSIISPFVPFIIDSLMPGMPAKEAGLLAGDQILSVNGAQMSAFTDISREIKNNKSKTVVLGFKRKGQMQETSLEIGTDGLIGVALKGAHQLFELEKRSYTILQSIPAGIKLGFETLAMYAKQMKLIFTSEGAKQVGGFGSIGSMFPVLWDWEMFWSMTALLSVVLAFMNILPIPALDGGHIVFLVYEMISGRKPSEKVLEAAQIAGMALLFALLIFANGNDLIRYISK
jgi:regulator of sigma E protease